MEGGLGKSCLMHAELQFSKMKSSGGRLYNDVNVLNATEHLKMVKVLNCKSCILFHNSKERGKKEKKISQ